MFWILRRTGAVNLFNSINNNYSSKGSSSSGYTISSDKSTRPPRKAYGRLSVESDDYRNNSSSIGGSGDECDYRIDMRIKLGGGENDNNNSFSCLRTNNNNNNNNNHSNDFCEQVKDGVKSKKFDDNVLPRLQTITLSDDDDYDESLTCNVCDRAFQCHRQLSSHQQKKRHFGCSGCDSLFPSLMLLEHHKEEFEHWSDSEDNKRTPCCRRNRRMEDDDFYDTDTGTSDAESEDMERLL